MNYVTIVINLVAFVIVRILFFLYFCIIKKVVK
ncbi:hypothetical protein HMPREF1212_01147 [Parabacteroides sp. HGS0025]|nr:hypothetical protein HMPREF1212_01147 [Parabacteroides sp. HGS0025]